MFCRFQCLEGRERHPVPSSTLLLVLILVQRRVKNDRGQAAALVVAIIFSLLEQRLCWVGGACTISMIFPSRASSSCTINNLLVADPYFTPISATGCTKRHIRNGLKNCNACQTQKCYCIFEQAAIALFSSYR